MKKFLIGIIVGIVITVLFWYGYHYIHYHSHKYEFAISGIVKEHIERTLEGARVLDISTSESNIEVNYAYDKLYDAHIKYERNGIIKKITAQYGYYKGVWIVPQKTNLEILDDKAEVIYKKKSESGN